MKCTDKAQVDLNEEELPEDKQKFFNSNITNLMNELKEA